MRNPSFIPLSANQNDAYFRKGIAEELLNALTKFPELKVAARTSAFSFEDQNVDLREVGRKLGVAHVLESSVRSSGDKVRATAQ
jgi:TolB-like protein